MGVCAGEAIEVESMEVEASGSLSLGVGCRSERLFRVAGGLIFRGLVVRASGGLFSLQGFAAAVI